MPLTIRPEHPSHLKLRILALALASLLSPITASAWADSLVSELPVADFIPSVGSLTLISVAAPISFGSPILPAPALSSFDGSLNNPAVAAAYLGPATPEKLAAALAGLRPPIAELPLIVSPGPCWYCGSSGFVSIGIAPGSFGSLTYVSAGPSPSLITAGSDADLGAPGAPVTLSFSRLRLSGSFATGRDFIVGDSGYPADHVPSDIQSWESFDLNGAAHFVYQSPTYINLQLPTPIEPDPSGLLLIAQPAAMAPNQITPGGPGWIDTDGHDLKITGVVTSHQKLWKEGEGTLWLTGANIWHAAPEVIAGVLKGDATSLDTDIVNGGLVSFEQLADGVYGHVISGAGGLEKTGAGTLSLTRSQTYQGRTDILQGTLRLSGSGRLAGASVNVAADATLDASTIDDSLYLTDLQGAGQVRFGGPQLSLQNLTDNSFSGRISGPGCLVVTGSATLSLTGTNDYAGDTLIVGGKLAVAGDASLGASNGAVILSNSGSLILLADMSTARVIRLEGFGGNLDSNGHDLSLATGLEGNGSVLTKKGAGTLFLTAAASFSGNINIAEGALALIGAGALNPATHVGIDYGVLDLSGADGDRKLRSITGYDSAKILLGDNNLILSGGWGTFNGVIAGQGGLILDGIGVQTLTGANTYTGATRIVSGTLRARAQSLSDRVINNGRLELFDYGKHDSISAYSGDISGSGMLVKTDESTLWLRGNNTYTGGTLVEKGVLIGNHDSLRGDIETRAGLAFYQVADGTYAGRVSGTGTLMSYGPGALTLTGDNSHTGGTAFSNTLRIGRDSNLGGQQSGLLIAGGTLVALDNLSLNRHVALGEAGARFDSNGFDIRLNGRIDGPGGVTKLGDGVLVLAGEHGYTGATRIEQGGMVANGSFAGDVEVLDGAWFEAKGRIGGDLNIAAGALFSAGNSPGVLEVAGDFIAPGEILVEIAAADNHDFIQVGGIADLTGATLHFVLLDSALPGNLDGLSFLSAAGGIIGLDSVGYEFGSGLAGYRVARNGDGLFLAPVPEPESWAMLLAGLGLVGFMARRRTKDNQRLARR